MFGIVLGGNLDKAKKIAKEFKEKIIFKNIYKKKIYLKISSTTIIPINLIYKKPIKRNLKVFIFLAGSTSGVHIGWGEAKVPIDHQRIFIGADIAMYFQTMLNCLPGSSISNKSP